ncbi:uncharacterized protein LOC143919128 [Arctopsyche grandis]|uniref:uncharacterized protein LOC143919128 n=1 Tax=Arctopsyche grandis TaxID=121162 RepID=UPI00406D77EA
MCRSMMECRLCLCPLSPESSVPIFDASDEDLLKQQIFFCCNLHVEEYDGFPNTICLLCKDKLDSFTIFRNDCIQSDETLKTRSTDIVVIKTETIEPDVLILTDECVTDSSNELPESYVDWDGCEPSGLEECEIEGTFELTENKNDNQFLQERGYVSFCTETLEESRYKYHAVNKPYQCHDCLKTFINKGSLMNHTKTHKIISQLHTLKSTAGLEFSTNQRGNKNLTYLGFQYNKFRENKETNVITWRCKLCRTSGCRASIKTYERCIVGGPSAHGHDSCPQKIEANIVLSKMRESIKYVDNIKQAIGNEMIGLNDDVVAHLPKRASIIRVLSKHKQLQG